MGIPIYPGRQALLQPDEGADAKRKPICSDVAYEIKMIYVEAETQLSLMETEANALAPNAAAEVTGNVLDVAAKLDSGAKELEHVLATYQTLLLNNIKTSKNSVQYMKEQDGKISTAINGAVLNKSYMTYA